jgi:hypothetical protein
MRRCSLFLIALLAPSVALAMPPERMPDPGGQHREIAGSDRDLPVGCRYGSQELIRAALEMRAVRTAVDQFMSRGYIALPSAHVGVNGCVRNYPGSAVGLTFTKPGAFVDSTKFVWPMILVTTVLSSSTGEPATSVSGGLVVFDGAQRKFVTSEDLDLFPSEPIFDVRPTPHQRGTLPDGAIAADPESDASSPGYEIYESWRDGFKKLSRWARCTGISTTACGVGIAIRPGGMLVYSNPETAVAALTGCFVVSGIGCLGTLWED